MESPCCFFSFQIWAALPDILLQAFSLYLKSEEGFPALDRSDCCMCPPSTGNLTRSRVHF